MSKKKDRPAYEDDFEKYVMAVALLRILYKDGLLPEEMFKKIEADYEKDVEKYKQLC